MVSEKHENNDKYNTQIFFKGRTFHEWSTMAENSIRRFHLPVFFHMDTGN